ncbi:hypothetical protein DSL72_005199 [Monilinia vaccinii-corymbosi]|uniref:Uncharacterized protein n=1 Tax=Monilinia vaccinii-corymbosi TaxID=61207 RepID=A0A8A3PF08_9HELO|nr:hypothetical protein DSL72_005199 [Monilinia vaccinii-corymbosi]
MASASVTAAMSTSMLDAPSTTSMSSSSSSKTGISNVAIAIVIFAIVASSLMLAVGGRWLWKRRASQQDSMKRDTFRNIEEGVITKHPGEHEGNNIQTSKWEETGVHESFRVQTERITSCISPLSPKSGRSRDDSWGKPRGLLATIDELLRGAGPSPEPVGRIDTSPVRWSASTVNSPTSPEMTEPRGALFPAHHYQTSSKSRESLPPTLPALDLPSIALSATSRPNIPCQSRPKTPSPQEFPVKSIYRLDGPFADAPDQAPTSPLTVGISYSAVARSPSVSSEQNSHRATFPPRSRFSIASITNRTHTPTPTNDFTCPSSPPIKSPSAESFHTFGDRSSTQSQASISTFQTFPVSHQDITDHPPPLPAMPSIYPMSSYTKSMAFTPTQRTSFIDDQTTDAPQYHHTNQTSISKIKPKMIYISNTAGIFIQPSDPIIPPPIPYDPPSPNPFTTPPRPQRSATTTSATAKLQPTIAIKSVIDRFNTLSAIDPPPSCACPPAKLKPSAIQTFQPGSEKDPAHTRQEERSVRRKEKFSMHGHGQGGGEGDGDGDGDLGERVTNWYDATA